MPVAPTRIDPLRDYREGVVGGADRRPIPLTATTIGVTIDSAFATVRTRRTFRNLENASIEATMTFPVPVDAVAHGLRVEIDGRALVGVAQAKARARAAYEEAIDAGKTAILHEEALKGVHVLAIGHIPPGREVAVEITWSKPLSFYGSAPSLRIPTTVAEIYGRLPLLPADDLVVHDRRVFEADLTVRVAGGLPHLRGAAIENGKPVTVKLDRPIDLSITGLVAKDLEGTAADGRCVSLTIAGNTGGDGALRLGILFDRSGSTGDPIDGYGNRESTDTWSAARAGLREALSKHVRAEDAFELWQFDSAVEHLGAARGSAVRKLLDCIGKPRGGTEAGQALGAAVACEAITDVVFITDGRTGAIPVQAFAGCGKRVSAVLCGANSLDAMIGHLCALTGGQIIVAAGDNVAEAIMKVVASARRPMAALRSGSLTSLPGALTVLRGGASIQARWSRMLASGAQTGGDHAPDAVGAYAAALALPMLTEAAATDVAVAHALCSHLTSLIVIDDVGEAQEGVPNQRKVPLSRPVEADFLIAAPLPAAPMMTRSRVSTAPTVGSAPVAPPEAPAQPSAAPAAASAEPPAAPSSGRFSIKRLFAGRGGDAARGVEALRSPPSASGPLDLSAVAAKIDWDAHANALSRGDLSCLAADIRSVVEQAASLAEIAALAAQAGIAPATVVIGLLAEAAGRRSRGAERVARHILIGVPKADAKKAASQLGL